MDHPEQLPLSPEFFAGAELLQVEEHAKRGTYSGAIIERQREKVQAITRALAEGVGVNRIAKVYGVSIHTVMGLRDRNPQLIAAEKQALSRQYGRILRIAADRYEEALVEGQVSPSQLPVAIGIIADKKALLDGDPTLRVEHGQGKREVSAEDVRAYLERLKSANPDPAEPAQLEAGSTGPVDQKSGPTDVESIGSPTKPVDTEDAPRD